MCITFVLFFCEKKVRKTHLIFYAVNLIHYDVFWLSVFLLLEFYSINLFCGLKDRLTNIYNIKTKFIHCVKSISAEAYIQGLTECNI